MVVCLMRYGFTFFFIFFLLHRGLAQPAWDAQLFSTMRPAERYRFVHDFPFWQYNDGKKLSVLLTQMLRIAEKKQDHHTVLAAKYYMGQAAGNAGFYIPQGKTPHELYYEIEKEAKEKGYLVEEIVVHQYLANDLNPEHALSSEAQYVEVQRTFERMQAIGFEKFKDYNVAAILFNLNQFMWELGDFDQAFQYLNVAEQFIEPTEEGGHHYTQVLSYIQTYWKLKKDFAKSLVYAQKILHFHQNFHTKNPERQWWNKFWKGFISIEIADLLSEQGDFAQSEQYANQGYALSKSQLTAPSKVVLYQAEFDALQVLISVKLKLHKLDEAHILLQRSLYLQHELEPQGQLDYFKPLRLYRHLANYYEMRTDAAAALRYTHLAQNLQDSLDQKNDARKLAQIQRKLDAEKYAEQVHLLEKEKRLQQGLNYAVISILVLISLVIYQRLRHRSRQNELELEVAQKELFALTQGFLEKAELAENLRQENEKLSEQGKHSAYLEQLSQATILTEEDWTRFRAVFEKVHPGFILEQKAQFPELTQAETRLLVLEKLGLGIAEMANMSGVNKNTIYQTRLRFRRKIEGE